VGRALDFAPGAAAVVSHFVVCGVSPGDVPEPGTTTQPPAPELLFHWSAAASSPSPSASTPQPLPLQLLDFCFPRGRAAELAWASGAEEPAVREALVDPQHETTDPFVFLISGERAEPLFGVCITRAELARLPPPILLSEPLRPPAAALAAPFPVTRRCYAVLSRHALLPLMHEVLSAVLAADFAASADVRRDMLIRLLAPTPSSSTAEPPLITPAAASLQILRFVGDTMRVPAPGDVLQYRLPASTTQRSFRCPVGSTPRDSAMNILMEWSLVTLFECLSLESASRFA